MVSARPDYAFCNYHLQPFVGTWNHWNGPAIQEELALARDLGVNTVRIGVPYDGADAADPESAT